MITVKQYSGQPIKVNKLNQISTDEQKKKNDIKSKESLYDYKRYDKNDNNHLKVNSQ